MMRFPEALRWSSSDPYSQCVCGPGPAIAPVKMRQIVALPVITTLFYHLLKIKVLTIMHY